MIPNRFPHIQGTAAPSRHPRRAWLLMMGATLLPSLGAQERPVRIGLVGVGRRGAALLKTLIQLPGVEVPAVCDINEQNLNQALTIVEEAGQPRPQGYANGVEDYRRLVERDDLEAVITATPWELHTPICVATMNAGKYAATEVPAAVTAEQCWELVEASERSGKPCMMLENVCYFRNVLAILNMIQQGVFGKIKHCEAGYQHNLRHGYFNLKTGDLKWRGMHALKRNGNLYPTHPIGAVAWWANINRGDRFRYLVSMSSGSGALRDFVAETFSEDHPNAQREFALGDVNTSLIRTANGVTVTLYFDTSLPRPYDLILRVQGTKAIYSGTLEKIYIENRSPNLHEWEETDKYYAEYEHPIWKELGSTAIKYGHRGGDYMELHQFVKAVRERTQTPIDVYDSATWSVISPLSEKSVASKSAAVDFPDFTRGKWRSARPIEVSL